MSNDAEPYIAAVADACQKAGKCRYLGRFVLEEDAARAYDDAARKAFPDFAYLNFPGAAPFTARPSTEVRFCGDCGTPITRSPRGGPWPRRCPPCATIRDQAQRQAACQRYQQRKRTTRQAAKG